MKRREFIAALGGLAATPFAVRAQQTGKSPVIGVLGTTSASAWGPWIAAFMRRMNELGWFEGRNLTIELRWAEGRNERYGEIAREFVQKQVDVIVTSGGAVRAVKQATSAIPVVFAIATDPVGSGIVSSLARPGGNATGLSTQTIDLAGKKIELFREVVPKLGTLALIANAGNPNLAAETKELEEAARSVGIQSTKLEIRRAEDIAPAFETLHGKADALYVQTDPLTITNRVRIVTLALTARLPTMHGFREFVEAGGLLSYGPSYTDLFRRAGEYVDKILRGSKPSDLPVQQPTKFDLIVNLTTAKALGFVVPPSLLARADEVIE